MCDMTRLRVVVPLSMSGGPAERCGLRSHAERGNDGCESILAIEPNDLAAGTANFDGLDDVALLDELHACFLFASVACTGACFACRASRSSTATLSALIILPQWPEPCSAAFTFCSLRCQVSTCCEVFFPGANMLLEPEFSGLEQPAHARLRSFNTWPISFRRRSSK